MESHLDVMLKRAKSSGEKLLAVLIDPDKPGIDLGRFVQKAEAEGGDKKKKRKKRGKKGGEEQPEKPLKKTDASTADESSDKSGSETAKGEDEKGSE